jgi:hypothetical protein
MNVLEVITQVVKQTGEYSLVGTQASGGDIVPDYTVDNGILYYVNKALRQLEEEIRVESRKKLAYYKLLNGQSRIIAKDLILIDSLSLKNGDGEYAVVAPTGSSEVVDEGELSAEDNDTLELKVSVESYEYNDMFKEVEELHYITGYTEQNYAIRHVGNKFYVWGGTDLTTLNQFIFEYDEEFTLNIDVLFTNHGRNYLLEDLILISPVLPQAALGDVGVIIDDEDVEMTIIAETLKYAGDASRFVFYDLDDTVLYTQPVTAELDILAMRLLGNTLLILRTAAADATFIDVKRIINAGTGVKDYGTLISVSFMKFFDVTNDYIVTYVNTGSAHSLRVYTMSGELLETVALDSIGFAYNTEPLKGLRIHGQDIWAWTAKRLLLFDLEGNVLFSKAMDTITDIAFLGDFIYVLYRSTETAGKSGNSILDKFRYVNGINSRSLLFNFTAEEDYIVKVRGRFYPTDLTELYQTNFWLTRYPQLVIDLVSHYINFPRLSAASNALLWEALMGVKRNLVSNDVEQEIAISGSQIRG